MASRTPSIPEGLDLITTPQQVIIRRRWFSWMVFPMLLFAIVWDGFLVFWYSTALLGKNTPWIMILFPIGHVAVGVGVTYYVLCSFFNRTDVILTPDQIAVATRPLPWPGNRRVPLREIHETEIRTRYGNTNQARANLVIMFVDGSNKERKLVTGITEWDHAEYMEGQIRRAVRLPEKA